MIATKWEALWGNPEKGYFISRVIKKSDIPKYAKIVIHKNEYYKEGTKRPMFQFAFADTDWIEANVAALELQEEPSSDPEEKKPYKKDGIYYTEDGDRLYTYGDAKAIIEGTYYNTQDGYYYTDILPDDFV